MTAYGAKAASGGPLALLRNGERITIDAQRRRIEADVSAAEFKRRRDVIVKGLNKLPGFKCLTPDASFYVFPSIKGTGMKSKALADALLSEAGVACLPGTSFGSFGEGYLRFSYANSVENIEKGLAEIAKALPKLAPAAAR